MNYKLLLKKYIEHVGSIEGVIFLRDLDRHGQYTNDVGFKWTDEEWAELNRLADTDVSRIEREPLP